MQTHLVAFEYGRGAVWGYVNAPTRSDLEATLPELEIVEEPPAWMTERDLETLRGRVVEFDHDQALDRIIRNAR